MFKVGLRRLKATGLGDWGPTRAAITAVAALAGLFAAPAPAGAIPVFAHRYGFHCQQCHTAVPHLNEFGEAFLRNGYQLPGAAERGTFPIATKVQIGYSSAANADGLPKVIVDEIEVLFGGRAGQRFSYFGEVYAIDGGFPGRPRDVWLSYRLTAPDAATPLHITGGQFTLPLPVEPETFRETTDHYAIFDQTAGDNPFAFFDPRIGLRIDAGNEVRGTSASVALLKGQDRGSGLPAQGLDRHLYVQHSVGALTFSGCRYDGSRPIASSVDRFWREGYGIAWTGERMRIDAVYQRGYDAVANQTGAALRMSGGLLQVRHDFAPRLFGLARYEGTADARFSRRMIAGAGYRLTGNSRLTVFDTIRRGSGLTEDTVSAVLLFAY